MADLSRTDIEKAEFCFSIYDADGSQKVDAFDLGDILRSLNCNPTLALIEKIGATKKRGEKLLSLEEFLPIYGQVKKEKEQGCYEDFLECLKLYDKNEDGTMLLAELQHALLALGENLNDDQVNEVFKDCMGEEDDDGNIKYAHDGHGPIVALDALNSTVPTQKTAQILFDSSKLPFLAGFCATQID